MQSGNNKSNGNKYSYTGKKPSTKGRVKLVVLIPGSVGEPRLYFTHYNKLQDLLIPLLELERGIGNVEKYFKDRYIHQEALYRSLLEKILPELVALLPNIPYFKRIIAKAELTTAIEEANKNPTLSFDEIYESLPKKTWKEIEELIDKGWITYGKEEEVGGDDNRERCEVVAEFLVKKGTQIKREIIISETEDEIKNISISKGKKPPTKNSLSKIYNRILKFLQRAGIIKVAKMGIYYPCFRLTEGEESSDFTMRRLQNDVQALKEGQQQILSIMERLFGKGNQTTSP